jgi:hypothetical protein
LFLSQLDIISGVNSSIRSDSIFLPAISWPCLVNSKEIVFLSLISTISFLFFRFSSANLYSGDNLFSSVGSISINCSSMLFFTNSSFEAFNDNLPLFKFINALLFRIPNETLNSLTDEKTKQVLLSFYKVDEDKPWRELEGRIASFQGYKRDNFPSKDDVSDSQRWLSEDKKNKTQLG